MRNLFYVPIIHTSADLGSLAEDITERSIAKIGEEIWTKHNETVSGLWESIAKYFESLEVKGFKIYQDGMPADGEIGQKIVDEGVKSGSQNYEVVSSLIQRGAILVKTEDFALVSKELGWLYKMTRSKTMVERVTAYLANRLIKNRLLGRRDRFIADRINQTLGGGETGILFIGAYHNITPRLSKDILVREVKKIKKIRDYQKTVSRNNKNRKKLQELSKYLVSPIR